AVEVCSEQGSIRRLRAVSGILIRLERERASAVPQEQSRKCGRDGDGDIQEAVRIKIGDGRGANGIAYLEEIRARESAAAASDQNCDASFDRHSEIQVTVGVEIGGDGF